VASELWGQGGTLYLPQVQDLYPLYPPSQRCSLCKNFKQTTLTTRLYKVRTNLYPRLTKTFRLAWARGIMFSGCLSFCVCVRAACISQQYQSTGLVFSNLSYKQLLLELVPCLFCRTCRVDVWKSSLLISFLLHVLYIFCGLL